MRSQEEIRKALERLADEPGFMDWKGDNFQYGLLIGKSIALEWVQGESPSSDLGSHFDFEDWLREQKEAADELKERLKGDEGE